VQRAFQPLSLQKHRKYCPESLRTPLRNIEAIPRTMRSPPTLRDHQSSVEPINWRSEYWCPNRKMPRPAGCTTATKFTDVLHRKRSCPSPKSVYSPFSISLNWRRRGITFARVAELGVDPLGHADFLATSQTRQARRSCFDNLDFQRACWACRW
jgi:hypothetical protein